MLIAIVELDYREMDFNDSQDSSPYIGAVSFGVMEASEID